MVVAGRVHIEAPVHQVVDIRLLGRELEQVCDAAVGPGMSFLERFRPGPTRSSGHLETKITTSPKTFSRKLIYSSRSRTAGRLLRPSRRPRPVRRGA